ncbi:MULTISPECIES: discoidin domain-containing protein [unclassified Sphingobacterium]|uniref:discoidin domain-containing protein n=1 Tax=unclassified Sphingobacterium TaxID=2609468 RepID=UPI0010F306BA|nr:MULTISPECIES: discoidin domain-containing protein [unclassified Sphingobacterium]MCS3554208.1 hypothetical protein [Sphingobacterium sp. JUb21]TCR08041.1 uncharacterized protein DUF1735 [Sphingobacterium sp. JUb20]
MKFLNILSIGLCFLALSCEKAPSAYTEAITDKNAASIYVARFTGKDQPLVTFPFTDEARSFKFNASFGAVGVPAEDIAVEFAIDQRALDSVNSGRTKAGLTPYEVFPADAYKISNYNTIIKAGELHSDYLSVDYFSSKFDPKKDYMLPISVSMANGYKIGSNKTIFLIASQLQEVAISKTNWSITANSEELVGEGSSNGRAQQAIDNNVNTYWHSKWQGTADKFPHWLQIDMKEESYVTRIDLSARQNTTNGFTKFNIEASKDGTKWTVLGQDLVFDPANKAFQQYPVEHGYWQFIKIVMTVGNTSTAASTNLGEINIYRY